MTNFVGGSFAKNARARHDAGDAKPRSEISGKTKVGDILKKAGVDAVTSLTIMKVGS